MARATDLTAFNWFTSGLVYTDGEVEFVRCTLADAQILADKAHAAGREEGLDDVRRLLDSINDNQSITTATQVIHELLVNLDRLAGGEGED